MNPLLRWLNARDRAHHIAHQAAHHATPDREALLAIDCTDLDPALTVGARLLIRHHHGDTVEAFVCGTGLLISARTDHLVRLDDAWPYDHTVSGL